MRFVHVTYITLNEHQHFRNVQISLNASVKCDYMNLLMTICSKIMICQLWILRKITMTGLPIYFTQLLTFSFKPVENKHIVFIFLPVLPLLNSCVIENFSNIVFHGTNAICNKKIVFLQWKGLKELFFSPIQ